MGELATAKWESKGDNLEGRGEKESHGKHRQKTTTCTVSILPISRKQRTKKGDWGKRGGRNQVGCEKGGRRDLGVA